MERMIACCGLVCSECPAFIATQKNDFAEKVKVAKIWSEMYKSEIKPEDINCDGCLAKTERHIAYYSTCEIRKCASEKNLKNCAYCDDYPCSKLNEFLNMAPEAKTNLEGIRKNL
jgi:hypothetical protein